MSQPDRFAPAGGLSRNTVIVSSVVLFHVAAIWALQSGLVRKAAEIIVPAELLSEFINPPAPKVAPPPPKPAPTPPAPKTAPKVQAPKPAPMPLAINDPTPAPNAPTGATTPQPPAPPITEPVAAAPAAPPAPPAPPKIELPSSDAAYLNNPKPSYPAISKRMGEQGKVVLRVLIGTDGTPQKVEVNKSSGYERLDRQAQEAVMRWRFVPGKRNGVPETMWNLVPVNFVLE
ncbi:energy transducer TonB [Acidovorax sp. 1608163]|jgi:protein TonB|uniref:energy transducer TonB n=1 Tax=unclassified Acidovorax TaxID=2684926 RepID=UPI000C16EDFC|nr:MULTISPECIES: energy transducer TonB [unclassified Acidovorax]AYM95901.1 energy transducer TonB [Acidovorax sp. 1608163]MCZ8093469.1 energy transducer TonB [Acidovorax sp.]PIF26566.1 outer membrane transport energization protein TonB [Acidovorax sp. 56]RLJ36435.1 outer membrane transport energization protein TonB [Acidovorax sp. 106]